MNTGFRSAFAALVSAVCHRLPGTLLLLPLLASAALAQTTTTVSGTVFDPRTTASSFPLPNILVYVTTNTPAPLPAGVQCLTTGALPTDAQIYTSTAVDGTFTLTGVPVNQAYTLVIQAGKWRRQWPLTVNAVPVTGLALHMPASRNDGDIPLIAIATGSADGFECVFHDMGIADTEFTDDNGVVKVCLRLGQTSVPRRPTNRSWSPVLPCWRTTTSSCSLAREALRQRTQLS